MSLFTYEDDFTYYTQDKDHGSKRVDPSVGAIVKSYRRRQGKMTPYNEDSFSASLSQWV